MARRKLFEEESENLISPLIDVVMNGMAAMFIILMVYLAVARPSENCPPPRFLLAMEPPPVIAGQSYLFTFPVVGCSNRRFVLRGKLPEGLRLDPRSGTVFGVARAVAEGRARFPLEVAVEDDRQGAERRDVRKTALTVLPAVAPYDPGRPLALLLRGPDLPGGRVGLPYEAALGGRGGVEPYVWRLEEGRLPAGLRIEEGRLAGQPAEAGLFEFTIRVLHEAGSFEFLGVRHDWLGASEQRKLRLRVLDKLASSLELPVGRVGEPYLGTLHADGLLPDEKVVWKQEIPGLAPSPDGLSLVGTPQEAKKLPVSFAIQRGGTQVAAGSGTVRILPPRPAPRIEPVPVRARVGESVRCAVPYRGLLEPVTARLAGGSLPAGLKLDESAAVLTGTPEKPGTARLQIELVDAAGAKHQTDVDLSIRGQARPLRIEAPPQLALVIGRKVSWPLFARGGEGDYRWAVRGSLPAGLAVADGRIEGEARESGSWKVELAVQDLATGENARQALTLEAVHDDPSPLRWMTSALPPALAGAPFDLAFAVAGGIGEPRFEISGALPEGLSFDGRTISGKPLRAGAAEIVVTARDAVGREAGPRPFQLVVKAADSSVPAVVTRELPPAVPEREYHLDLAAEGGIGAYSWELSGDLPPGLRFTERGIHGTVPADTEGAWRISAAVRDELGRRSAAAQLSLLVLPLPVLERPLPEPLQAATQPAVQPAQTARRPASPPLRPQPSPRWEMATLLFLLSFTAAVSLLIGSLIGRFWSSRVQKI